MNYAVIKTGGKQYRVELGTELSVEILEGERGQSVEFGEVLLVSNGGDTVIGSPLVEGAKVTAEILAQHRGEKLIVFKKIRRHGKQRKMGHRQNLTKIRIKEISQAAVE